LLERLPQRRPHSCRIGSDKPVEHDDTLDHVSDDGSQRSTLHDDGDNAIEGLVAETSKRSIDSNDSRRTSKTWSNETKPPRRHRKRACDGGEFSGVEAR
jgi:hypothetical protein